MALIGHTLIQSDPIPRRQPSMRDLQPFLIDDLIYISLRCVQIAVPEQDLDVLGGHFRFGQEGGRRVTDQVGGNINTDPFAVSLDSPLEIPRHYPDTLFCAE